MRANANATILNKGTAIENPEIKKEVQFVFGQMNFFFLQVHWGASSNRYWPFWSSNKSAEKLWGAWVLNASV